PQPPGPQPPGGDGEHQAGGRRGPQPGPPPPAGALPPGPARHAPGLRPGSGGPVPGGGRPLAADGRRLPQGPGPAGAAGGGGDAVRLKKLLLSAIRFYQRRISPGLPPRCRFIPTCSQYALEAIEKYGPWKGGWLALRRFLRCHPFYKGDIYDPVP